jgi:hypothetical protein
MVVIAFFAVGIRRTVLFQGFYQHVVSNNGWEHRFELALPVSKLILTHLFGQHRWHFQFFNNSHNELTTFAIEGEILLCPMHKVSTWCKSIVVESRCNENKNLNFYEKKTTFAESIISS